MKKRLLLLLLVLICVSALYVCLRTSLMCAPYMCGADVGRAATRLDIMAHIQVCAISAGAAASYGSSVAIDGAKCAVCGSRVAIYAPRAAVYGDSAAVHMDRCAMDGCYLQW